MESTTEESSGSADDEVAGRECQEEENTDPEDLETPNDDDGADEWEEDWE